MRTSLLRHGLILSCSFIVLGAGAIAAACGGDQTTGTGGAGGTGTTSSASAQGGGTTGTTGTTGTGGQGTGGTGTGGAGTGGTGGGGVIGNYDCSPPMGVVPPLKLNQMASVNRPVLLLAA